MVKIFSTVRDTQRISQSYMKKRRGRREIKVTRRRRGGIKRGESSLASNQFPICSPQCGTLRCTEFHREEKREDIGSLSEKEFRRMIVKMIQNLENKMELQINSLETRIEKMQEMLNKDLEEIKKSQSIKNNAVSGIKSTLEGTNSIITQAEDSISESEDRMVEINEAERKKELNEMRTTSETSGTMSNTLTFQS